MWLCNIVREAASVSLAMVNSVWYYYGRPGGRYAVVFGDDCRTARLSLIDAVRMNVRDGATLVSTLSEADPATLYKLVFDPSSEGDKVLADVQSWAWIGPFIIDALRAGSSIAARNCAVLLGGRVAGRDRMAVDAEALNGFFDDAADEVIAILEEMAPQVPEDDQVLIRNVVAAARGRLAGGAASSPDSPD